MIDDEQAYIERETARLLDGRVRLCACGCGHPTRLATHTSKRYGHVAGRPLKFINGHNRVGHITHGWPYETSERGIYSGAKYRCENPKAANYENYGGRGIRFFFRNFQDFMLALGPRPSLDHSLERRLNDGPYCAENCYWATRDVQEANKRHNNQHCAGRPMLEDILVDMPF
jgi:hypothetical protein